MVVELIDWRVFFFAVSLYISFMTLLHLHPQQCKWLYQVLSRSVALQLGLSAKFNDVGWALFFFFSLSDKHLELRENQLPYFYV